MGFKVEIRDTCKVCDSILNKDLRQRTYCSSVCRNKVQNKRHYHTQYLWQKARRDRDASKPSKSKIQCLVCGKYYRRVGSHITQVHHMTARQYREEYGFDVKRGQVTDELREVLARNVFENGTINNLKKGKKYRFKKGQSGLGLYQRSEQTLERLKNLHKIKQKNGIDK